MASREFATASKQFSRSAESNASVFVARQPVLDRQERVFGYELLFRADWRNMADFGDPDQATARVILNTFVDIGVERLVGANYAFFNLTRNLLLRHHDLPFPSTRAALEVPQDISIDAELVQATRELAAQGFSIVLNASMLRSDTRPLFEIAHFVKINALAYEGENLAALVQSLRKYHVKLIAEKVETYQQYDACRELGFDFFQGYFFCKPQIFTESTLPEGKLNVLRLLAALEKPDVEPRELETIIRNDVALSYKLLRCVNSAYFGLSMKVNSIAHGIVYLGVASIRNWARLLVLAGVEEQSAELLKVALLRARMCELLAPQHSREVQEAAFTVGLFSVLDALMNAPMRTLLMRVPLTDDIKQALLDEQGPYAKLLVSVRSYERGHWSTLEHTPYSPQELSQAYLEALDWAEKTYSSARQDDADMPETA
jgi:EAL and modified HD-GYP domain-containing signal transduction protein